MTSEAYHKIISTRFQRQIVEKMEITPVVLYDNSPDKEPDGEVLWMRMAILPGESFQVEFGTSKRFRTPGIMMVQIFDVLGNGDNNMREVVDIIKSVFRAKTDTQVKFQTPTETNVGRDGKWWQVNVTCPFFFDEFD